MSQENVEIVRRALEAFARGGLDAALSFYDPDVTWAVAEDESEAATLTAMRLARAYDRAETAFVRIATAVAKYWVCKRGPGHAAEALECLGGNGYVEESFLPRIVRETPLNSVWEGSGNVICLDVLRAMSKDGRSVEMLLNEIRLGLGADRRQLGDP